MKTKRLGAICDLQNGFAFKSKDYVQSSNTMNFRMSQIRPDGSVDLQNNPKFLPDEYAKIYKNFLLKDGDVVIAMTDLATETKILGVPTTVRTNGASLLLNQRVGKLFNINEEVVYIPFLRYVLTSPQINDYYKTLGRGGLQINISKQDILNAKINLLPLDEQKRIVGILDEVFEGVAKAKENVEGNLRNVSEVFEAYLQSVFTNCGKGWEENSLGNICEIYQPRTISTKEMKHDGQYVVYGANGVIGKYDKYNHEESQLLITCRGATCGSVNISTPKAWINGNAMVVRPKDESLNREFLTYFFRNGSEISKTITGAAQPQITRTTLAPLKIGFPKSLSEQKSIVTKLDALSTETKKLEAVYKEKLNHLEELKKSILKKAFNGEL